MSDTPPAPDALFVGIDVSKGRLDVAARVPPGRPGIAPFSAANDSAGIDALVARLAPLGVTLVALEATGGLEARAAAALAAAGVPVAVVNPRQVHDFAKATARLAKTDPGDAAVLAHFADAIRPQVRPLPDEQARALDALLTRRRQLVEMLVMERNRLGSCADKAVSAGLEEHVDWLEERLAAADKALEAAVEGSEAYKAKADLLSSIKGVGPVTTRTLLAEFPELGSVTNKQAAALAGLAPYAADSGKRQGKRRIAHGRGQVRSVLYMAAQSARRHNPALSAFAERLKGRGKAAKVVLVAVARKLLVIANAVLRSGKPWSADFGTPAVATA